jgi:hypothetical protein
VTIAPSGTRWPPGSAQRGRPLLHRVERAEPGAVPGTGFSS